MKKHWSFIDANISISINAKQILLAQRKNIVKTAKYQEVEKCMFAEKLYFVTLSVEIPIG